MEPVNTKALRALLKELGCTKEGTRGSHEKWKTPGGLSDTIVAGKKNQSPGLARNLQRVFTPEFGDKWLEEGVGK